MLDTQGDESYQSVKSRLDEIAQEVAADDINLDDALALYEEAVKLGLRACDLSEADIFPEDTQSTPTFEEANVA